MTSTLHWRDFLLQYREKKAFDAQEWVYSKTQKFNSFLQQNDIHNVVVAVSGGVDSAVTLALMCAARRLPNSPLQKIYAINQPISSSDWALQRSRELCATLGVSLFVIDQSDIHSALVEKLHQQGFTGNVYTEGQLKSYMRTPINYAISQIVTSCVVVGTGNKDEDGYLGYFCKYGDGAVDVQLIADLHKSEVFAVGAYLGIPESILCASPSADLWENQEDETEIGCPYDFVEFYTGCFLSWHDDQRAQFLADITDADEFITYKHRCDTIHSRNKHKFSGVINL